MANLSIPTNAVDLEGLGNLRRRAHQDDPAALAEVAVQFEALFIGMMLESARSASLHSGLFDSNETEQYLSLMDRQVALELARKGGFGFGEMLRRQLEPSAGMDARAMESSPATVRSPLPMRSTASAPIENGGQTAEHVGPASAEFPSRLPSSLAALGGVERAATDEPTPAQFVTALLPEAKAAAAALGVEPRLLLAQAALETGWGRSVTSGEAGGPAHNLFGIKAGPSWSGAKAQQWTLEHANGVTTPQREAFRSYGSARESFADYVDLIATARRYAGALEQAHDSEAYARAVTEAGYATDPAYADKWLAIYRGDRLENALRGIDLPASE